MHEKLFMTGNFWMMLVLVIFRKALQLFFLKRSKPGPQPDTASYIKPQPEGYICISIRFFSGNHKLSSPPAIINTVYSGCSNAIVS